MPEPGGGRGRGARGATAPPPKKIGRSLNPIPTMGGGRFCPPFASGTPNVFYLPASLIRVYLLSYHFADQLVNLIFRTNNENICRNPLIWLSGRLLYKSEHIKSSQLWPISISLQIFHIYIIFFHICKIQKKQL